MFVRSSVLLITACLSGALLAGCAGGSSSGQPTGTIPSTAQGAAENVRGTAGHIGSSGVRRTESYVTCSGTGTGAFRGGAGGTVSPVFPNSPKGQYSFIGAGSGNDACDGWSAIVTGFDNIVSGSSEDGFIGSGESNVVTGSDDDSAIVAGYKNEVASFDSAIVNGQFNFVSSSDSFLGGGDYNSVTAQYGVIGGGLHNTVSGEGGYIAAGGYNTASGQGALVDGGFNSTAAGTFATVPGGYANSAGGTYSFAAGARASAAQTGTFVWSDGSDGDTMLTSARAYQFLARASGGVTFYTNATSTVGAQLAPGSGTWASASDRNLKTDVTRIDDAAVLDKVAALPIERWSYKSERGVRHVGPMAQDFYAAFGVGEDDKHITSIDEDGVALAAIKALRAENMEGRAAIEQLRAENAQLRVRLATAIVSESARMASMQAQMQRLSAQVVTLRGR